MRNASNAVARSIGRMIAVAVLVVVFLAAAVLMGLLPIGFAP